ncbi:MULTISPECIES: GAF and ANTAR domain-containing protein [unclassified Nonomuraea]|uniref:GAF and ANTAR domain-containing protein n=1 Tax=unclassified Nonomuraea TaxID=2593643 RepID=UPI0035C113CF
MDDEHVLRVWALIGTAAAAQQEPVSVGDVCVACADSLEVSGAGLSVVSGVPGMRLAPVHAVGRLGRDLLEAELTSGDGPCVDAVNDREPVLVADLRTQEAQAHWPLFTALTQTARVRAVFAFPLLAGPDSVGVLVLCQDRPRMLEEAEQRTARHFADAALLLLLNLVTVNAAGESLPARTLALGPEIHQASGVVAVQADCTVEEALVRLRAYALAADEPLTRVARQVLAHTLRFSGQEG